MKIPKEIADKVEVYQAGQKAFREVVEWLQENTEADGVFINDIFIAAEATGEEQGDGEYCDQHQVGYCEDSFCGRYYHPIEGSTKYFGYYYDC